MNEEDKLTPLQQRIVDLLLEHGGVLRYDALAYKLWPPEKFPKAWRYSSNGGPHGWCMPLGKALRILRDKEIAQERYAPFRRGDIVLAYKYRKG